MLMGPLRVNSHRITEHVEWVPPNDGWLKINFDRALKGNLGPYRIGVVERLDNGCIVALAAKRINNGTNKPVEFQAMVEDVMMCIKLGAHKIHIEGDS